MPVRKMFFDIWNKSNSRLRFAGLILIILAIGSSIQIIQTNQVRRELMECQIAFMDQTVRSLDNRSKTSSESSEALEALIAGLKESTDSSLTQRLYDEYLEKRRQQKEAQAENPYPEIELSKLCYGD